MANEERIAELASKWYQFVSMEHHKDRDCHFGIDIRWSYSNPPTYHPWHAGYIGDQLERYDKSYDTLQEAQEALISFITLQIDDTRTWIHRVLHEDPEWYDESIKEQARKFIELFGE